MAVRTGSDRWSCTPEQTVATFRSRVVIGGDLAAIDDLLTADFRDHFAADGVPPGRDGVRHHLRRTAACFDTTAIEIVHSMRKGNVVMQAVRIHLKHTGEFMGVEATGKECCVPGFDAFEVRGGKIARHWGAYDFARIPDLIGLTPVAGAPAPAAVP